MFSQDQIIILIISSIAYLSAIVFFAWILSFFFRSKEKLAEMKKQTDILKRIEEKLSK